MGEPYDSSDEYNREERVETIYQGWGAREMAERLVELEDEIGADVDGVCTGMHADVAEAQAAWSDERLRADRFEAAWLSARRRAARYAGAWRSADAAVQSWRHAARSASRALADVLGTLHSRTGEADRYRIAWLSARRRAADEANFGLEALERERARQASYVAELRPTLLKRMEELKRHRAFADDVIAVRGWCMDGTHEGVRRFLDEIYGSTYELEAAQRENRPFRARLERRALRGDFDEVAADEVP